MVHMPQIADNSIQLIAWAFKVEWQRHHFSLPELQISFAHPGEIFIGMWCPVCALYAPCMLFHAIVDQLYAYGVSCIPHEMLQQQPGIGDEKSLCVLACRTSNPSYCD